MKKALEDVLEKLKKSIYIEFFNGLNNPNLINDEIYLLFCNNVVHYSCENSLDELKDEIIDGENVFFTKSCPYDIEETSKLVISLLYIEDNEEIYKYDVLIEIVKRLYQIIIKNDNFDYGDYDLIDFHFYTLYDKNIKTLNRKYNEKIKESYGNVEVNLHKISDILDEYQNIRNKRTSVENYVFRIDEKGNYLSSPIGNMQSVVVNISSMSIKNVFESYGVNNGPLYHSNLRYYVKNKKIDDDIKNTIIKNYNEFWYLNNGIVIICEDYEFDDKSIILKNFSFVNGGQTSYIIGNIDIHDLHEFYVVAKIIKVNSSDWNNISEKISISTNKQKPINEKDLLANSSEIMSLSDEMKNYDLFLISKRGQKIPEKYKGKENFVRKFTIDEVFQISSSFMMQIPGTTKNKKSFLFKEPLKEKIIKKIKINELYTLNLIRKIIDLIDKNIPKTNSNKEIYKVGKLFIFSMISFCIKKIYQEFKIREILNEYKSSNDYKKFLDKISDIEINIDLSLNEEIEKWNENKIIKGELYSNLSQLTLNIVNFLRDYFSSVSIKDPSITLANFTKKDDSYANFLLYFFDQLDIQKHKNEEIKSILFNIFKLNYE